MGIGYAFYITALIFTFILSLLVLLVSLLYWDAVSTMVYGCRNSDLDQKYPLWIERCVHTHVLDNIYLFPKLHSKNIAKSLLLKREPYLLSWHRWDGGLVLMSHRVQSSKSDFSGFSLQLWYLLVLCHGSSDLIYKMGVITLLTS